jgi:hypothetical protein
MVHAPKLESKYNWFVPSGFHKSFVLYLVLAAQQGILKAAQLRLSSRRLGPLSLVLQTVYSVRGSRQVHPSRINTPMLVALSHRPMTPTYHGLGA